MADWLDTQDPTKVADIIDRDGEKLMKRYNTGNVRFALWLSLVDRRMSNSVGVTHRDISDWTWADAFEDEMSPREAAREALAADDTFGAMFT